jgi:predicted dehydrogenase
MAIVGCGGMGRRHLAGLAELREAGHRLVDLVAVCDLNRQNADDLADEAEALLGWRPGAFTDMAAMVEAVDGLEAAGCTTDAASHHAVATALLDLSLHVLCEKPLALTIRGCNRIVEAAERNGRILSVAENYRRDPMNRLVRALIDGGAIGEPQFMMETTIGGRDAIFITPWRHQKLAGTIVLDAGVHNADILLYYFGPGHSAYGQARLFEPVRTATDSIDPGGFYAKWAAGLPRQIEATGEDAIFGMITFANGALGQWVQHHAGHGEPFGHRMVFGTRGSIAAPGDRNGRPVRLGLDDGTIVQDEHILEFAPEYRLDPVGASLFGDERPWTYDFTFTEIDRKLLALEYAELAQCIRDGSQPEVDGPAGRDAVALVYALIESQVAGRPVTLNEIVSSAVDAYQREIDAYYGLV